MNRNQFVKGNLFTMKIFLNAAGSLRIPNDFDLRAVKNRCTDDDIQDPLDATRIHPEDHELVRKMATDALELGEEDIQDDEGPSHVVSQTMSDDDNEKNPDKFAVNMWEDRKPHTLNVSRAGLLRPYSKQRTPFPELTNWDVSVAKLYRHFGLVVSKQ